MAQIAPGPFQSKRKPEKKAHSVEKKGKTEIGQKAYIFVIRNYQLFIHTNHKHPL